MKRKFLNIPFCMLFLLKSFAQIPCCEVLRLRADKNAFTDLNNKVSLWGDASGNGNHVSQSNAINQPLLHANVFGDKPAIFFDGVNGKQFLSNSVSNLMAPGSARTIFIVGKIDSAALANGGGDFPSAGGTMFTFRRSVPVFAIQVARVSNNGTGVDYVYTAGLGTNSNATAVSRSFFNQSRNKCLFVDTYISSHANTFLELRQNGNPVVVNQANAIVIDNGADGFTVGDREDFVGQDWQGYIAEIIVYDRKLKLWEIKQVEQYLGYKYFFCNTYDKQSINQEGNNAPIVKLFPIPAKNNIQIAGLSATKRTKLSILDYSGNLKASATVNNSIYNWNIAQLKPGNYLLKIESDNTLVTRWFIKE